MKEEQANETQFMFYSGSKDVPPGKGSSEHLSDQDAKSNKYAELAKIKDWRRMMSNFYSEPCTESGNGKHARSLFTLDDRNWASVEHYFQAGKFLATHKKYYEEFAMESKSALSKTLKSSDVKKAGRKIKLSEEQLRDWGKIKHGVMKKALYAKYSQNEHLKKILLATKDAKLTHRPARSKFLIVEKELMQVRSELLQDDESNQSTGKKRKRSIASSSSSSGTSTCDDESSSSSEGEETERSNKKLKSQ